MKRYRVEGWHQPNGEGFGWAPTGDRQAEIFYIFDADGIRAMPRGFKTRDEANTHIGR